MAKKSKKTEIEQAPLPDDPVTEKPEAPDAPLTETAEEAVTPPEEITPTEATEAPVEEAPHSPTQKKRTRRKKQPEAPLEAKDEGTPPEPEQVAPPEPEQAPPVEDAPEKDVPRLEEAGQNLPVSAPGASVERAVPPIAFEALVQERRNFFKFLLMFLILGVALAASVFILLYRPGDYDERTGSVAFLYNATEDATTVAYNGKVVGEGTLPGVCSAYMYDSMGRRCAALIGSTLYLVDAKGVREVETGVCDFILSQNGATLVYRTEGNLLYYCPVQKELAPSRISGDTREDTYCLSPDGKELFYTYVQNDVTRIDVYSATNSKPHFAQVTGLVPVAVADRCEYLYYKNADTGELFYYEKDADNPVICHKGGDAVALIFNRDFAEMLIQTPTGTELWCRGERLVMPGLKSGETLEFLPNQRAGQRVLRAGVQLLVRSFEKGYYLKRGDAEDGTMLMYLGRRGELSLVQAVKEGESNPVVTDKAVYFLVVEQRSEQEILRHLYHCEIGKSKAERISWDVAEFCVNTDGSRVMYTDQHGALYALQIGKIPQRHADTIDKGTLCVSGEDAFYYYVGNVLYVSDNGEVPRVAREDATAVSVDAYTVYFLVGEEQGPFSVYANHRNRRRDQKLADFVTVMD